MNREWNRSIDRQLTLGVILADRAGAGFVARVAERPDRMTPVNRHIVREDLFAVDRFVGMRHSARTTGHLRRTVAAATTDPIVQGMRADRQRAVSRQD